MLQLPPKNHEPLDDRHRHRPAARALRRLLERGGLLPWAILGSACGDSPAALDGGDSTSTTGSANVTNGSDGIGSDVGGSDVGGSDGSTSNGSTSDPSASGGSTGGDTDATTTATTEEGSGSESSGSVCGDGVVEGSETCDDGNKEDTDGCASHCTPEPYYRCIGEGPGSCAPIRMLFAMAANDTPSFREAAAAITGGAVDYLDAHSSTPTLAELEADYDCVFTHPGLIYDDGEMLGDVLADYVDGGANVVLGIGWHFSNPPSGLAGTAIAEPGYAPVTTVAMDVTTVSYAGDGTTPIHSGVVAYSHHLVDTGVVLQGLGSADGTFDNGTIATAYRPDFKVVYVNGTGQEDYGPTGDWSLLIANACSVGYLAPP